MDILLSGAHGLFALGYLACQAKRPGILMLWLIARNRVASLMPGGLRRIPCPPV